MKKSKSTMVDGHDEEQELEKRGYTPKDAFGKEIHVNANEMRVMDCALTYFYEGVKQGNIQLYEMKPHEISDLQANLKRMWNE